VSGSRQKAIVSREYRVSPDDCARALEFLLKTSVSKEAAGWATSNDAKVRFKNGSRTTSILPT
jgi:hypothetical protein